MANLRIKNLHVNVEGKEILKGVDLEVNSGETVALLGPNGHGKSTLFAAIMGHPKYEVTDGEVILDGVDILSLPVNERSKAGIFLGMQHPSEVPGVINAEFLKAAMNVRREKPLTFAQFYRQLEKNLKDVKIPLDLANRSLNEGFSGGEKKRNEILQMLLLNPLFAMLDEIDSGLDVDALQTVAHSIKEQQALGTGLLVISHYARLYDLITPTRVAVMINGKIAVQGGVDIIKRIDTTGYDWIREELGIVIEKQALVASTIIGTCATKEVVKNAK